MIKHKRPIADESTTEPIKGESPKAEIPKVETEVKGSKQVNVEVGKKIDEKVQIDFMGEKFAEEHASKKTKENTDQLKSSIPLDKKVGEIREDIAKSEAKRNGDQFTFKDILQIATFLINAFDGGIGILLNFIAKDNRVSVYTLPVETKRQLSEQLALILVKYQVKFKIEFLFFITLVLAYMGPVGGALKHRKSVMDGTGGPQPRQGKPAKAKEPPKDPPSETASDTTKPSPDKTPPAGEEVIPQENADTFKNKPPRKEKRNSRKKASI